VNPSEVFAVVAWLVERLLDLVGYEAAAATLTEAAIRRQNAIADTAEAAKFGKS
jgi:hypothetical protein